MAMSATEMERKVSQLDNDVSEIYTMIADIQNTQRRHTHRFNEMGVRLDRMIDQLGTNEARVDRLDQKVDTLDTKVDALDTKVSSLDTKVDALDTKFDALGTKASTLDTKVETLTDQVGAMAGVLDQVAAAVLPPRPWST